MALCFLLVLPFPAFATSIVALIGEESITIAADSVGLELPTKTGEKTIRHLLCKILCVHHFCFAAAGSYVEPNIGYSVWRIAQRELLRPGSLEEVAERFRKVVEPLMPKVVTMIEKNTPSRYAKLLEGISVLEYLFAGFDTQGKPLTIMGEVTINNEGHPLPIRLSVKRGESGKIFAVLLGERQHIGAFLNDSEETWPASAARDPSGFTERMVRMEIEASEKAGRRDVGEPITAVRLTANGVSPEKRGVCREK